MLRTRLLASLLLLGITACSQAYSDRRPTSAPMVVEGGAPAPASASPYQVEILGENGESLQTFEQNGRYYVLGASGSRYTIHVTNPTDARVEAVATVDGLDVIDGEDGNLAKRGYVISPHGDLSIEGFRTSTADVATFRFSSVDASYAGRKGKARNVGVIAVALFAEAAPPPPQQIVQPVEQPPPPPADPRRYYDDEGAQRGAGSASAAAPPAATTDTAVRGDLDAKGAAVGGGAARDRGGEDELSQGYRGPDPCCTDKAPQQTHRGGLGTEYGEQRYSAASWTRFVRASDTPVAVAELRYNDAAGLSALGIPLTPPPDSDEITKRETADPFPGDDHYARPPAGIE